MALPVRGPQAVADPHGGAVRCPSKKALSRAFPREAPHWREHFATCATCQDEWNQLARLREIGRSIPVAQLDPDRAEEVRTALLARAAARAPTPSRIGRLATSAAVLCAAAIAAWFLVDRLRPGSTRMNHGTTRAQGDAVFVAVSSTPDEVVRLVEGTISVEVTPLAPGQRFRVVTDDGEVEVRGTAFDVTAAGGHLVRVEVSHGRVEVRTAGAGVVLHAGESWSSPTVMNGPTSLPGRVVDPAAPMEPTALANEPASDHAPIDSHALPAEPVTAPSPTEPHALPGQPTPDQPTSDQPASDHSPTRPTSAPPSAPATHESTADRRNPSTPPTRAPTLRPPASASTQPTPSAQAHPPEVKAPAQPASSRPPSEVAFEDGWRALQSGDAGQAAVAFEHAARLAPTDPLAEDAWFLHALALARAGDHGALAALETYLANYPVGARAGEAAAMAGWLLIDGGEWARAERYFQAALGDRSPTVRASAHAGLDAVQAHRR